VKNNHRVAAILAGCALAFAGCSSSGSNGSGSGGQSSSSGGTTGSGGTSSGSGGKGSGGSSSSSSGGSPGSGGTTGSSSGGATGSSSGGKSGSGGATGSSSGGATGSSSGGATGTSSGGATGTSSGGTKGSGGAAGASASGGTNGGGGAGTASGGSTGTTGITVALDKTHQTIQGFGINDALAPSSAAYSSTVLDNLFTTKGADGIGLSILRIGMNSDGSLASASGDISGAKSRSAKIIGSCWSPPANCKTNNNTKDGGHLCSSTNASGTSCSSSAGTSCYDSWSTSIATFAKNQGLYAMSVGNEPDFASCGSTEPCNGNYDTTLYTANELVAFVKVVGPKLKANNVKVIAPEASEWIHTWSNVSGCCSDPGKKNSSDPLKCGFPPSNAACDMGNGYDYGHYLAKDATAWAAFDILGTHEYDTQHAEPWPSDVTGGHPDSGHEVWETEMSGVKWWLQQGPSCDIANGVAVGGWIHSALVTGEASAWLYWWYQSYYTDDNEGLLLMSGSKASGCDASKPTKRYYVLGQYSKFVRPGYKMVEVSGNSSTDLLISAFKGTDGTVVVVAVNQGSTAANVPITIAGGTAPAMLTPTVTSATDNLAAKTAVTVTNGSFMASLPAQTVTTFVGM